MAVIEGIIGVIVFFVVLALVLGFITFMLPIMFSLGTIFDKKVNNQ